MNSKPAVQMMRTHDDVVLMHRSGEAAAGSSPTMRILLLIGKRGNREQVGKRLRAAGEILIPSGDSLPEQGFDLAIVDGRGLGRWQGKLKLAKQNEKPAFLPVMLILTRAELRKRAKKYQDIVDEFIITPSESEEFLQRTAMLLRARGLAVQQRQDHAHAINHDQTTGLQGIQSFLKVLEATIQRTNPETEKLYVVAGHIPMDLFSESLGHDAVEEIIGGMVSDLQQNFEKNYSISRFNVDQGATLLPAGSSVEDAVEFGLSLIHAAQKPRLIRSEWVNPSAYVRIINYPDNALDGTSLLEAAMAPMSETQLPGVPILFSPAAQQKALEFMRIKSGLHRALERQEFELWFQPKFRLSDLRLVGAEALIRWRKDSGEMVSPGQFIPVADQTGLIQRIDTWVIEVACAAMSRWQEDGPDCRDFRIAVNITPTDLAADGFVPWLEQVLHDSGLGPSALEVEVTETMLMKIGQPVIEKLRALRQLGIRVSIDDFGTGYSSLSYLYRLPVDTLKIDKSFIDQISTNESGQIILNAIIGLGEQFGMELIAEGIETREQLQYLQERNVQTGQGFLVSRPLPEPEFIEAMKNGLSIKLDL